MPNELLLILSLIFVYGGVITMYKFFGTSGLYCSTVIATITANIEVMLMVDAFGMEQTLGNILFAATFLVTDILSENHGKVEAKKAVNIGIVTSIAFILISQSWLLYTPADSDWARESFDTLFSNTPRLVLASLIVYAICQRFDVWLYHRWWAFTVKKTGERQGFLWLRNNGSTLISQLLNSFLYNFAAFWGMYGLSTLISISIATYVIYIATSLLDTPALYIARKLHHR